MKTIVRLIIIVAALSTGYVIAQEKPREAPAFAPTRASVTADTAPPTLSEIEKLKIDNLAKRLEIAQLKAQNAQADFDKARTEITALVQSLQKDGYDLDLQTFTYTPKKAEKK